MPYFVIIENSIATSGQIQKYRASHLEYVEGLHKRGKIYAAGRFLDNSGGIIIVDVGNKEEAVRIANNDPYILNKVRDFTIKEWDKVF